MKAYIKDCTDINGNTKALLNIPSGKVKLDRLVSATSTFTCTNIPDNVSVGDIFILLDDNAARLYYGKIKSFTKNNITTNQIMSIFDGTFIYSIVDELKISSPQTYLENEIAGVLNNYKDGEIYQSTYVDPLINQELSPITVVPVGSLEIGLPTDKDKDGNEQYTNKNMLSWLYELYETYGIALDFTIPLHNEGVEVKVWKPNYSSIKLADGFECVLNIQPTNEQQTTNKLIIYSKEHVYRDTVVLTSSGIVHEPLSIVGRPNQVNTKIVESDDDIDNVIAANLSDELFNHKIQLDIDLESKLFNFDTFKLDLPIQVFNGKNTFTQLSQEKNSALMKWV